MSKQKPRRFKLRNGAVVEENYSGSRNPLKLGNFIDEYIFLTDSHDNKLNWSIGDEIVLELNREGFPLGSLWGSDYDIIEEISSEEQN